MLTGNLSLQDFDVSGAASSPEEAERTEKMIRRQGGLTALLHAARQGHIGVAMALIYAGADIDHVSGDHTSPLQIATMNGHFDLALRLIERGADANIATDGGATPLFAALNLQWAPRARYPQPRAHDQQEATYLDVMEALRAATRAWCGTWWSRAPTSWRSAAAARRRPTWRTDRTSGRCRSRRRWRTWRASARLTMTTACPADLP